MSLKTNHIYQGHALEVLKTFPDESIDMVMTSPPYWSLRAYGTEPQIWDDVLGCEHEWEAAGKPPTKFGTSKRGHTQDGTSTGKVVTRVSKEDIKHRGSSFCIKCSAWLGELGLEPSFNLYIKHLCDIFDEIQRVLAPHGTVWVVIGDSFYGSGAGQKSTGKQSYIPSEQHTFQSGEKPSMGKELPAKCMVGIPERFMLEMINRGWLVRNKIIWWKPAALPESVKDRHTIDYENIYLFTKNPKYYFKQQFEPTTDSTLKRIGGFTPPVGGNKYTGRPEDTLHDSRFSGKPTVVRGNRNKRCVWKIGSSFFKDAHFACVDSETECLAIDGWRTLKELRVGTPIFSYNLNTMSLDIQPVQDIAEYFHQGEMISVAGRSLDMLLTPNHRVLTFQKLKAGGYGNPKIVAANRFSSYYPIPIASTLGRNPTKEPFTPNFASLLGWVASDGHYKAGGGVEIDQSITKNRAKVEAIESLLKTMNADYLKRISLREYRGAPYKMATFRIKGEYRRLVRHWMPDKFSPPSVLLTSSTKVVESFIDAFVEGDGCVRKDGRISITNNSKNALDLIQALYVARLGMSCTVTQRGSGNYAAYISRRNKRGVRQSHDSMIKRVDYEGIVWCPKVENGTWIARRNGRVFITGNTFPIKLIEGPIDAGCPKKVCVKCGTPVLIKYEAKGLPRDRSLQYDFIEGRGGNPSGAHSISGKSLKEWREKNPVRAVTKSCDCGADFRSGIVLDPFLGSGTVGLVAKNMGLDWVGIELKESYVEMAHKRIDTAQTSLGEFM